MKTRVINFKIKVRNNIFEYNPLNQQVKAITKEGNTLVSRYDAEGLRAEIEENEKLTKFIFHKDNVLVETDKDYNVVSRFTRGYEIVAADIGEDKNLKLRESNNLNRYYYSQDEQGSTSLITDNNENIKNEYHLDAFGNTLESTEEVYNRITYTGQQFDGITKQYYLRARYYNPVIGRFTQEDTYRGDGLNLYAYCRNNPVEYFDPSGFKGRVCPPSKENNWNKFTNWKDDNYDLVKGKVPRTFSDLDNEILDSGNWRMKYEGTGNAGENTVYRALNSKDAEKLNQGLGLEAKNPTGTWKLDEHLIGGSGKVSWANDPFISTISDIDVARGFNQSGSNLGIVEIDLNKVPSQALKGYEIYPRVNGVEGLPYHYSIWQQETSVYQNIPIEAIKGFVK